MRDKGMAGSSPAQVGGAVLLPALLARLQAAAYLGLSKRRLEGDASIPKVNVAPPGSRKPQWRYEPNALDQWIAEQRRRTE